MNLYEANSWEEALEQGWWRRPWRDDEELPSGKPVLFSYAVWHDFAASPTKAGILYQTYLDWLTSPEARPERDQLELIAEDGKRIWVKDDGEVVTICYPYEA